MSDMRFKEITTKGSKNPTTGFKIIEYNVSDSSDYVYAVVTPVKK